MAKWFQLEDLPIRITARGAWLHGNQPLHPRVADLFARNLVPKANGEIYVQLGMAKQLLEVEDTAYFVRSLQVDAQGPLVHRVVLLLSDGVEEVLDPGTVHQGTDHVLYCRIVRANVAVRVRFTAGQANGLGAYLQEDTTGFFWTVGGRRYAFC